MQYPCRVAKYPLTLMPLISVSHGHCQYPAGPMPGAQPEYGTPSAVIAAWAGEQAHWVHVVDEDAANGTGDNHLAIAAARGARVQVSGGITGQAALDLALEENPARVVLEPADLDWVKSAILAHGDRVAVNLDVRRPDLLDLVGVLDGIGASRYLAFDVPTSHRSWHHDDRHLLSELLDATRTPVMAVGGIRHLDDLHRLHELVPKGLDGIILGEPLYDGSFTYAEAMAASADRFDLFFWGPPQA